MTSVAVCIPTYRRPAYLRDLLRSLAASEQGDYRACTIVVDNDATGSARAVVEPFAHELPRLLYAIEPARGIAPTRNHLVALAAREEVEYIAFVDDDEWVVPGWLAGLMRTAVAHRADAVAGPVLPAYEAGIAPWIRRGGFFDERPRHRSGARIRHVGGTGNTLLRRDLLTRFDGPFDRDFALTGGEDSYLFYQIQRRGARIVWCDEAVAYERIPASRATIRWLLTRQFNYGIHGAWAVRKAERDPRRWLLHIGKALARIAVGPALLPAALHSGRAGVVRALGLCAKGAGGLLGLGGYGYQEYRQIHGR